MISLSASSDSINNYLARKLQIRLAITQIDKNELLLHLFV